jgi:hypothetical protein
VHLVPNQATAPVATIAGTDWVVRAALAQTRALQTWDGKAALAAVHLDCVAVDDPARTAIVVVPLNRVDLHTGPGAQPGSFGGTFNLGSADGSDVSVSLLPFVTVPADGVTTLAHTTAVALNAIEGNLWQYMSRPPGGSCASMANWFVYAPVVDTGFTAEMAAALDAVAAQFS